MFVKAYTDPAFRDPAEASLFSIDRVLPYGSLASHISAESGQRTYYSKHPPAMVRKALTLYAGLLSGRQKTQIPY
jgi:hypothetical protein